MCCEITQNILVIVVSELEMHAGGQVSNCCLFVSGVVFAVCSFVMRSLSECLLVCLSTYLLLCYFYTLGCWSNDNLVAVIDVQFGCGDHY